MSRYTALPIVIAVDEDDTPAVLALCGAEAATMRRGTAHGLIRLRAAPPALKLDADVTAAGVLRMILHAQICETCQALQQAHLHPLDPIQTPAAGRPPLPAIGRASPAGAPREGAPAGGHHLHETGDQA